MEFESKQLLSFILYCNVPSMICYYLRMSMFTYSLNCVNTF